MTALRRTFGATCVLAVVGCWGQNPLFHETEADDGTQGSTGTSAAGLTSSTTAEPCVAGQVVCFAGKAATCDGAGGFYDEAVCPDACADGLGCVECVPGLSCQGDAIVECDPQGGNAVVVTRCDPLLGLTCSDGACVGPCADLPLSEIGCEFYPTATLQHDDYSNSPDEVFAVTVLNTTAELATITISRGDEIVTSVGVLGGSTAVVPLPWVDELVKGKGTGAPVVDGAFRMRVDRPVVVYQFNSLDPGPSNDSSLLLPAHAWGNDYTVVSRADPGGLPGFYAVTAREDGTVVELVRPNEVVSVVEGGGVEGSGDGTVILDAGDVIEVVALSGDLTGSRVAADRPVQVISGHKCLRIKDQSACDHLEETMPPISALGMYYVIAPRPQVPVSPLEKAQTIRVVSTEPNTTVYVDLMPPVETLLEEQGDILIIPDTTQRTILQADRRVLVATETVDSKAGYGDGDPTLSVVAPREQWRGEYKMFAPTSWANNGVHLIAPSGAKITVDGVPIDNWSPVLDGYDTGYAIVPGGVHTIAGDQDFTLLLFGVDGAASYAHLGGMHLNQL